MTRIQMKAIVQKMIVQMKTTIQMKTTVQMKTIVWTVKGIIIIISVEPQLI